MLLMRARTEWSDYFTGNPTLIQTNEYGTPQTPSGTNVYILNCLFRNIATSGSNGGALSCTNSVSNLLIESSSFFSCKTSGRNGGAVYFENTGSGQFVLYKVCGYDCYSTYTSSSSVGMFSRVYVKNDASSKNYVNYSSFSGCSIDNSKSHYALCQQYGIHFYASVNSSLNKCYYTPGICCNPYGDSNYVTCSLSFSSFTDNNATGYTCIYFATTNAKYEIKSCNILRNTQGSDGNVIIEDSCILENKANYIFHAYSSYTFTLSNCTIDSNSCYGSLITQNTVTKNFILALNHMSTRNCHAEYDTVGTLTPVIESSKKRIYLCTCGRLLDNPPQGNFVLLISVFVFTFIHPYVSNGLLYIEATASINKIS
jgi:hypothetical protein